MGWGVGIYDGGANSKKEVLKATPLISALQPTWKSVRIAANWQVPAPAAHSNGPHQLRNAAHN
ncbi:hypothetical protein SESBI_50181 [Sesbania bispinosa]|nr:hypothetical protein SESBI_50181 [Sesbania bispinosa]